MECPKCKKKVGKHDVTCKNCGIELIRQSEAKNSFKNIFKRKNKNTKNEEKSVSLDKVEGKKSINVFKPEFQKKLKLFFIITVIVLIIILIVVIVIQFKIKKGSKTAQQVSQSVGMSITNAEKELKINFKDNSAYSILNDAIMFDYVYESDSNVVIDDIKYPKWSVTVLQDSADKIEKVIYSDYNVLKKDSRGKKLSKKLSLDFYDKGAKYNDVVSIIDFSPFKTTYTKKSVSYDYRYYYTQSDSNAQSVILTVVFDLKGKFLYYTSVDVYPQNM